MESGNVYIPRSAPWVGDFIEECASFPNAAHDDQVDAMTQALIYLYRKSRPGIFASGHDGKSMRVEEFPYTIITPNP